MRSTLTFEQTALPNMCLKKKKSENPLSTSKALAKLGSSQSHSVSQHFHQNELPPSPSFSESVSLERFEPELSTPRSLLHEPPGIII